MLLLPVLAWAGTEPNPADYTINVRVSSARFDSRGAVRLMAVIDGKKYELQANDLPYALLALGDYKARTIPSKIRGMHAYDVSAAYEFLFPDKKTRKYAVVGITE